MWGFIVLSQQLSGAAVVLQWLAYIHLRLVWSLMLFLHSRQRRLEDLARRSDESLRGENPEFETTVGRSFERDHTCVDHRYIGARVWGLWCACLKNNYCC